MPQLIKSYPEQPSKSQILLTGDLQTLKSYLDKFEKSIESNQLSKCGKTFIEFARHDDFTLNTCIYNNIDSDEEETFDINYVIFK
jgi:hypothetical protein